MLSLCQACMNGDPLNPGFQIFLFIFGSCNQKVRFNQLFEIRQRLAIPNICIDDIEIYFIQFNQAHSHPFAPDGMIANHTALQLFR